MTDGPVLRWGILGAARISADVIAGLQRSDVNELVAIASRDAERVHAAAAHYHIPNAVVGYDGLLRRDDIDCVYIPLPNHLHGPWTQRALEAGKHVLCEKPFVADPQLAMELFTFAQIRELHLAEAFMYRHHPKTHALKHVVESGQIGDIHTIRSWFTYPAEDAASDIRFQPSMDGGALRDVGSYPVSMCNYLLSGEPESVAALQVCDSNGVDERFYGLMRYANGVVASIDCSMQSQSGYGVTVVGSSGSATLACPWYSHKPPAYLEVDTASGTEQIVPPGADNAYFLETENFADVVLNGAVP
ncbi:MAG TPA: Gfo/Idh/MocA family oxidoreductase, partial [Gemmatimonadaceae bacterium]|nr:Gfo/Idh/MocA family oxidoreductase [Gemmatimonadaceae bacterium]